MMGDHGITSSCNPLQRVEKLVLKTLDDFTGLFKLESGGVLPPFGTFSHLQHLDISDCNKMKKLIPKWLLQYLLNLTIIDVRRCKEMEEIITDDEEKQASLFPSNHSNNISNDERIPLTLPVCNGQPSAPPSLESIKLDKVSCKSLEWDNPQNKNVLHHFVKKPCGTFKPQSYLVKLVSEVDNLILVDLDFFFDRL
ncbi:hypothetical protein CQW23_23672 [Capsicum baccatum]|uniref:Disease resistance protein At4g27190-like leucine-rich repeats domain-containing protein n=1 Tax=Capsicum baccatum TaxID=33114 RepID=A0A2G2VSM7_CAPBA|nr:hypothetical protein CQW23_23672 [Capsicum baccatum]